MVNLVSVILVVIMMDGFFFFEVYTSLEPKAMRRMMDGYRGVIEVRHRANFFLLVDRI